jgi:hypothetical protein
MLLTSDSSIMSIDTEVQIKDLLVESNIMTIDPKSVTFHFDADDLISDVKPIEITTIRNLANVTASFVDFVPKDLGKTIPSTAFTLKPDVFDVITYKPTNVTPSIRSTSEVNPGTYEGYLKLSSGNVVQRLPITVTIDKLDKLGSRLESIIGVAAGIIVSVILLLLKESYKTKEEVRQSFRKAWSALIDAASGRRDFRLAQGYQSIVMVSGSFLMINFMTRRKSWTRQQKIRHRFP